MIKSYLSASKGKGYPETCDFDPETLTWFQLDGDPLNSFGISCNDS